MTTSIASAYFSLGEEDRSEVLELGRERTGRPAHLLEKDSATSRFFADRPGHPRGKAGTEPHQRLPFRGWQCSRQGRQRHARVRWSYPGQRSNGGAGLAVAKRQHPARGVLDGHFVAAQPELAAAPLCQIDLADRHLLCEAERICGICAVRRHCLNTLRGQGLHDLLRSRPASTAVRVIASFGWLCASRRATQEVARYAPRYRGSGAGRAIRSVETDVGCEVGSFTLAFPPTSSTMGKVSFYGEPHG